MTKRDKKNESATVEPYEIELKQLPIKWNVPDTIITRFASNMIVQTIEDYFKISFFEMKPEIHLSAPSKPPTEIKADCVASIIVTPDKFALIVKVLNRQLDNYQASQAQAKKETSTEP